MWVTFACFCEIRLQIDSISFLHEILGNLLWMCYFMPPFIDILILKHILALWLHRISHTVNKHTRNAIRLLGCEFGLMWVTFACFCEIWLQIDSILFLHEIRVDLLWMCYFIPSFNNILILKHILALWLHCIAYTV
jgi:hypothetical protein